MKSMLIIVLALGPCFASAYSSAERPFAEKITELFKNAPKGFVGKTHDGKLCNVTLTLDSNQQSLRVKAKITSGDSAMFNLGNSSEVQTKFKSGYQETTWMEVSEDVVYAPPPQEAGASKIYAAESLWVQEANGERDIRVSRRDNSSSNVSTVNCQGVKPQS